MPHSPRLLMIAPCFAPTLEVGRIRTLKFCKYLPRFGVEPVVLTRRLPEQFDSDLLAEIPSGTEVHRTGKGDLVDKLLACASDGKSRLKAMASAGRNRQATSPSETPAKPPSGRSGRLRRILFWPDNRFTWIPGAVRKGLALVRHCDAIYSSGPPMSSHLVAWRLAKLTGRPWIADYRDPWMVDIRYPTRFQEWLFWKWERRCVATCRWLINVNEPRTQAHREAFANEPPDKFVTLPNGFDPDDFRGLPAPPPGGPLTMTYLGNLYGGRSPEPVLRAIASLSDCGELKPGDLCVQLVGDGSGNYVPVAQALGIDSMLTVSERVGYREGLDILARSHVALMLGGDIVDRRSTPTKMYEYFHMDKPVLAIAAPGELYDLLEGVGAKCATHLQVERIAGFLKDFLAAHRQGLPLPRPSRLSDLSDYSREETARRLANMVKQVASPDV